MQRTYYIWIIISIVIMQIAQMIFSIAYNPLQSSHRGIPSGNWTRYITSTGFQQSQQHTYISTIPTTITTTGTIKTYNKNCIFWLGQCQSIIFQQSKAILTWLNTIQYIGENINTSLVNNLTNHIDSVITFAPKWVYPYILGNILWPTIDTEHRSTWALLTWENSVTLGEEWILYTCDADKIKKIQELTYTEFLEAIRMKDKELWNPCQDYRLPHILAFNYYQYLQNNKMMEFPLLPVLCQPLFKVINEIILQVRVFDMIDFKKAKNSINENYNSTIDRMTDCINLKKKQNSLYKKPYNKQCSISYHLLILNDHEIQIESSMIKISIRLSIKYHKTVDKIFSYVNSYN